ncbi:unnamed protein product [Vicia faba]|uniref:Calcium-transporting ATPase n=1 Tax=Vicia faba TaxID=3906 RepID=A0AAV1AUT7_VICFA|nr:unnamed protein product [Vicia faba]
MSNNHNLQYDGTSFIIDITNTFTKVTSQYTNNAKRRWRFAYTAIYSRRVMLSLAKEVISRKNSKLFHTQSSSTTLDVIEPLITRHNETNRYSLVSRDVDMIKLADMVKDNNLKSLDEFGGVEGVGNVLGTVPNRGIVGSDDDISRRVELFGSNTYKKPPPKGLLHFVLEAFNDTTIIILLVCAGLSLGFGIKEHGPGEGWYEGGSIFVAVFLVVVVSALSNFRQERQFHKLSKISNNIKVKAVRKGRPQNISIFDVLVGDIVSLKIGDQIPADGVFLSGHSLQVDESSMTGESDHVEIEPLRAPFLLSGAKVVDGYGQMLVTSVGKNTSWGQMMSSISRDTNERTPLQARLDKLTSSIGKEKKGNKKFQGSDSDVNDVLNSVVSIVAAAVTIVVVAIPEGLPLAVTLTLAYSMKRMMADHAMMRVTKFSLGLENFIENFSNAMAPNVLELFHQGVGLNTTGSVYKPPSGSEPEISGSPTEKAILMWAVSELGMDMDEMKQKHKVLHVETFNSEKKRSGVAIRKDSDSQVHVHWKGAAEMILAMCTNYIDSNGARKSLDREERYKIEKIIQRMAASSLRCIAFAHMEISDSEENDFMIKREEKKSLRENGLTLLGIVGLKDPCRPNTKKAVETCKAAGVEIKMITGDNIFTAKAIATECGILDPKDHANAGEVVEGVEFRNYTEEERMEKVDNIRVMARSSPMDKLLMVQCLRKKGHVVAVTGDGTNDAPALKEADIGLSMGIQGTEVAKESSAIVILDDNFNSVATVLRWGRCVYNNIQKFIQFQLTVNVAALVINFIAAVSSGDVPLTTVQLLWVNLIMDTLGALALATERPTKELMKKKPIGRTEPLITNIMWRNLLAQASYQIAVLLIMQFYGKSIFNVSKEVKDTLIFNTFVLCQVFNEFNSRSMEKLYVFEGILRNHLFLGIVGITIVLQILMVELLRKFADTERLTWEQWGICTGIAVVSWPLACIVKLIPVSNQHSFNYTKWVKLLVFKIKKAF